MINYNFKYTKEKSATETIIFLITSILLALFLLPFLSFWFGYFIGWISKILIGSYIVTAFNLIHIQITLDQIPLIGGLLCWIGCFFGNFHINNKNNN